MEQHNQQNKGGAPIDPIKRRKDEQLDQPKPAQQPKEQARRTAAVGDGAEYVTLPSQGVFYKGRFNGLQELKVRQLNWMDEDILTTKSYYDNGTLFNEILKNTIVDDNGFRAEQLVPIDKDAILLWLRIGAFGKDYTIKHKCRSCDKTITRTWDLSEIEMPDFNSEYAQELKENGEVKTQLPSSGEQVTITIPNTGREEQVSNMLKQRKAQLKTDRDFLITGRLLSVLSSVKGVDGQEIRDVNSIYNWIKKLPTSGAPLGIGDSRHIQNLARDIELEIDTAKDFVCRHCNDVEEGVSMPMTIYFFWPEYKKVS